MNENEIRVMIDEDKQKEINTLKETIKDTNKLN